MWTIQCNTCPPGSRQAVCRSEDKLDEVRRVKTRETRKKIGKKNTEERREGDVRDE